VTTYSGPVKVELVNAGTGSCTTTGSVCQQYPSIVTVASSQSFSSGKASVTVPAVANAYKDVCVRMTDTSNASVYGCSTGNFTIRPQSFTVTALKSDGVTPLAGSSLGASGSPTVAASSAFKIVASSGASNYTGSPVINSASVTDFLGSPTAASSLLNGSFSAAVSGTASGTFTYAEVGYVGLGQDAVVDTSYTAGSNNQSNSDCVSGSTSNVLSGGKYGCNIGSAASGSWGRFIPDHFALANGNTLVNRADIAACSASGFTYLGEDFKTTFTLVAQNGANQTTYNYAGSYAKLAALTTYASYNFASSTGTIGVGGSGAPSGSWGSVGTVSGGQATITAYHLLSRAAAPVAPYSGVQITATPVDSDGVSSSALVLGSSNFYYGRLGLSSATGASTASLQMPLQAYYYSSATYKTWVPNSADSCTVVPAGAVALSRYLDSQSNTTSGWTTTASASTLSGGRANLVLGAPVSSGGVKPGSVSVALNLGSTTIDSACLANHPVTTGANLAYLRGQNGNPQSLVCAGSLTYTADPSATATFGVYTPETVKTIYIRELY
jgi:MSHA biogenesis protein MshQ